MALASPYWELNITYNDRANKKANRRFRLVETDDAGDAVAVLASAETAVTNFQAASDCIITAYGVEKIFLETGPTTIPTVATALSTVVAQISGKIDGAPNESAIFDWPGPKDTCFVQANGPDADIVNVNGTVVDPIADMFSLGGTNILKISDGEQLVRASMTGNRVTKKRNRRKA